MALTTDEKVACRNVSHFAERGNTWGSPALGYCPIGVVVTMRGGEFFLSQRDGLYHALPDPSEPNTGHVVLNTLPQSVQAHYYRLTPIIEYATTDVLEWSGYSNINAMVSALMQHGVAAFPED